MKNINSRELDRVGYRLYECPECHKRCGTIEKEGDTFEVAQACTNIQVAEKKRKAR